MKKLKEKGTGTTFEVPESWQEVTVSMYSVLTQKEVSNIDAIVALTKLPKPFVEELGEVFCALTLKQMPWLQKKIESSKWKTSHSIDIRQETFGKLIQLENILRLKKNVFEAINIYFVTLQPVDLKLADAIPITKSLTDQLKKYQETEAEHLQEASTAEQIRAGVEKFAQFGRMNQVDALAKGDITKYDQVLEIDVNTVFIKLKQMKVDNKFQENYSKIMHEKNK